MKKLIEIFFLPFVLIIFASCSPLPSVILKSETCSPPCWNGITPGQTTLKELSAKLKSISAVDVKSIKTIPKLKPNESVDFHFLPGLRETGGRIYVQNDVVQVLSFSPKSKTLLLEEALQEWGAPDQYISIYYSKAEMPYLATGIIYTRKGIILNNIKDMWPEEEPSFDKNFPIQVIYYLNPKLITDLLKNGSLDALTDQDLREGLKSWTGFGKIEYLKRDLWGIK